MDIVVIVLRVLHIIAGIFWVGAAIMLAAFVEPAVRNSGQAGAQVMQKIAAGGLTATFAAAGGVAVVAGLILYSMRWSAQGVTGPAMTFLIGGIIGLISLVYGGAMTAPAMKRLAQLGREVQITGNPPSAEQLTKMQTLQSKLRQVGRANAILVTIAAILMAVARYMP